MFFPSVPERWILLAVLVCVTAPVNPVTAAAPSASSAQSKPKASPDARAAFLALALPVKNAVESQQPIDDRLVARMLSASCRLAPGDALMRVDAQRLVEMAVWEPALSRANRAGAGSAASDAETTLRQRIAQFESVLREQNVPAALIPLGRLHLASYQFKRRRLREAADYLDQLAPTIGDPLVCRGFQGMYFNLRGLIETEQSNYATAFESHARALECLLQEGSILSRAQSLNNHGQLLLHVGDYAGAQIPLELAQTLLQSLAASQPEAKVELAFVRLNLAKAIEGRRDFAGSAAILEKLLPVADAALEQHELHCLCRNNLAGVYYSLGQFEKSEALFEECRKLAVAAFGAEDLHIAEIDVNLGWLALSTGRLEAAESRFRGALRLLSANYPNHPRNAETLGYLARVLAAQDRGGEARALLSQALDMRETYLQRTFASALSERDRLAIVQALRLHPESVAWPGTLDTYLELAPRLQIPAAEQYQRMLAWKGVLAQHALRLHGEFPSEEARTLVQQSTEKRRRLRELAAQPHTQPGPQAKEMARLEQEVRDLERRLRRGKADDAPSSHQVRVPQVAAALSPGMALVDVIEVRYYFERAAGRQVMDNRQYLAFLVLPDGTVARRELGAAMPIENSVKQLSDRLATNGAYGAAAQRVAELTTAKLWDDLAGAKLLIVAGDGVLHRLPLAALPGPHSTHWIAELALATVPTAQSLVQRRSRVTEEQPRWLVVGGVDYGAPRDAAATSAHWKYLENTLGEAQRTEALFDARYPDAIPKNEPGLLTGKQATKQAVVRWLARRNFVHVATHGYFVRERKDRYGAFDIAAQLDSALVLANANVAEGDAGVLLTAEEIAERDLSHVRLMSLSACETALGHIRAGQGVVGLLGSLDQAGVRTVLSALWKVDDRATSALMQSFYQHLLSSTSPFGPAEALRAAQQELADAQEHPSRWAAWIVMGDPGPVRQDNVAVSQK